MRRRSTDGTYPYVFNNDLVDGSFGITSKIFLDQLTPTGSLVNSLEVPNSSQNGVPPTKDQMVTSFSSKSELALNLSTDGQDLTFMGYLAPINALDVSNSNTPGVVDPTNPVPGVDYRVVAHVDAHGKFRFTKTNAYSGNNGRAAILNNWRRTCFTPPATPATARTRSPMALSSVRARRSSTPQVKALVAQNPGDPTPVGSFNITQLGYPADKIGKDTNFRGLTIFDNVVYYTKGSGGNGINTVYFVDTTGKACPTTASACRAGVGAADAPITYDAADAADDGVMPYNMCILKGFPTSRASKQTTSFPFGIWFANPNTLYVADEGNGTNTFDPGTEHLHRRRRPEDRRPAEVDLQRRHLEARLHPADRARTWACPTRCPAIQPATTPRPGCRGRPRPTGYATSPADVNRDGTVTIYAVTSTVSGSGDQGADPNKLVAITDNPDAAAPAGESFTSPAHGPATPKYSAASRSRPAQ